MLEGQLVGAVLEQMMADGLKPELRRTYVQTVSAISRSGGYRLGNQLDRVVPLVLTQCMPAGVTDDAEMLEACLQVALALRLTPSPSPHELLHACQYVLSHAVPPRSSSRSRSLA